MNKINLPHAKALPQLAFSIVFERMAFYGNRGILMLYLIKNLNYSNETSNLIYGIFAGALVFTPLLGGLLGDFLFSHKKTGILGIGIQLLGTALLLVPHELAIYGALALIALGSGLYKPNLYAQVGKAYAEKEALLDGGFSVIMLAITIGSFMGPVVIGTICNNNYTLGFQLSGLAYLLAFIFQLKTPDTPVQAAPVHTQNRSQWTQFAWIFGALCLFWLANDKVQIQYTKIESTLHQANAFSYFSYIVYGTSLLLLNIGACWVFSVYDYKHLRKLSFSLLLLTGLGLLFLGLNFLMVPQLGPMVYGFNGLLIMTEVIVSPIIYSATIRHLNPKFTATLMALGQVLLYLIQQLISKLEIFLEFPETLSLLFFTLLIIVYLLLLKFVAKRSAEF